MITRFSGDISMPDIIVQCNENLDMVDKFDHYLSYEAINRNNWNGGKIFFVTFLKMYIMNLICINFHKKEKKIRLHLVLSL